MTFSTPEDFRQPILQWDASKKDFLLIVDWEFQWETRGIQKKIFIPAGQDYDKASVPRLFWGIARPDGPWEAAALVHDMLYKYKGRLPSGWYQTYTLAGWKDGSPWNRKEADDMLEFLGECGRAENTKLYKWSCKLYPVNWFKGF